jgi:hypothetical protein
MAILLKFEQALRSLKVQPAAPVAMHRQAIIDFGRMSATLEKYQSTGMRAT